MGAMNTVLVRRSGEPAKVEAALVAAFPSAEIDTYDDVFEAQLPELPDPQVETRLRKLSRELDAEVFWITYQTVVDAFQFHHWQAGRHLRSLVYGCYRDERTWERVEGTPEPWEQAILFDPQELASRLPFYVCEEERAELRRIWHEQDLRPGQDEPSLIAEDCAGRVLEAVGLV